MYGTEGERMAQRGSGWHRGGAEGTEGERMAQRGSGGHGVPAVDTSGVGAVSVAGRGRHAIPSRPEQRL